jgi:hypothetical protein
MKDLDEEGTIISSITVNDNDAADNKDDDDDDDVSDEPPVIKRKRRKYGCIKNTVKRKGKRQGTYAYKRVPTPDRKRNNGNNNNNNNNNNSRVITDVDKDNQPCEGLHLIGGRFVSCIYSLGQPKK